MQEASFVTVVVAFALVTCACEGVIIYLQKMLSGFADVG